MDDTSPEAKEVQASIHRRMTGVQRLELAYEMSVSARELAIARLRRKHPDWPEAEFKRELLRIAFGAQPLPPPLQ